MLYGFPAGFLLIIILFLASALFQDRPLPADRQRLETITRTLTSAEFDGRAFKSEGGRKASEYLAGQFREIGLKTVDGRTDYFQPIPGGGRNVIGVIEGRDRRLGNEHIIIGAHYDAFGGAFVGAADNAAGVAVMLEIARMAAARPTRRSLIFIAFDGEEQNLAGSKYYVEHPPVPLDKTAAVLVLNNFGRGMSDYLPETLYLMGAEYSHQLREAVQGHKKGESHLVLAGIDTIKGPETDDFHFRARGLPALFITNGYHYTFHSKFDIVRNIHFDALRKHSLTLAAITSSIADSGEKIGRLEIPFYDPDEAANWSRVLTALREAVTKSPENDAGLVKLEQLQLELKRFNGLPVQNPKAREMVIHRAANFCFLLANPNGADFNSLYSQARAQEARGDPAQAIAAYRKLLKFIEEEYRRDDQTIGEIRKRLAALENSK